MTYFGVSRFIPSDAGEIVFCIEIFEADVPHKGAKGFDCVDFITLGADEAKT
tara:strand:- start:79 stop:234 length:156 start_codon:yes stop_codon:yes gene_type:complete